MQERSGSICSICLEDYTVGVRRTLRSGHSYMQSALTTGVPDALMLAFATQDSLPGKVWRMRDIFGELCYAGFLCIIAMCDKCGVLSRFSVPRRARPARRPYCNDLQPGFWQAWMA